MPVVRRSDRGGRGPRQLGIVAGALLWVGAPATALGAICGQTIMQSVTLTADETCGSTVVVGADGITIDLGGFTISGDGSFVTGIDVDGHSGVTIKNGTLRFFTFGIVANAAADKLKLSRLVVHGMLGLGAIINGAAVTVEKSFFYANDQGGLRGCRAKNAARAADRRGRDGCAPR